MGTPEAQKALFDFFSKMYQTGGVFSRADILKATGWSEKTLLTYETKMIGSLYKVSPSGEYRMEETFRRFSDWKEFRKLVSQNKNTMLSEYKLVEHSNPLVFEFFLPMAHEVLLKDALDALFYNDRLITKLWGVPRSELRTHFNGSLDDKKYINELVDWLGSRFVGYSIGQVSGRYRASDFTSRSEALALDNSGSKYLIDETTAIVRFILPIDNSKQLDAIRYFFQLVFVQTVLGVVDKESEVWLLESGASNRLYVWHRKEI